MNSFLFSALALCLAVQCTLAQYQSESAGYSAGYRPQQRKLAPTPQTYQHQLQHQQSYGLQEAAQYEPAQPAAGYRPAPASYEERSHSGAGSYAASKPANYGQQQHQQQYHQQASGYGAVASSYSKPKPSHQEEPYYPPMPFAWGYDINDGYGGAQYHKENGDEYGKRTGSYGYTDAYGVYRQVDYVADENGFRATIKTNEPGTANESPADVELHAYEPPSNYYAGSSYSAPSAAYSPAPAKTATGYQAPAPQAYAKPSAGYQQHQQQYQVKSGYQQARPAAASYEPAQQYSSSLIVPIFHKSTAGAPRALLAAPAPAKRY